MGGLLILPHALPPSQLGWLKAGGLTTAWMWPELSTAVGWSRVWGGEDRTKFRGRYRRSQLAHFPSFSSFLTKGIPLFGKDMDLCSPREEPQKQISFLREVRALVSSSPLSSTTIIRRAYYFLRTFYVSGTLYTLLLIFPTFKANVIYAHFTEKKIGGLESLRNLSSTRQCWGWNWGQYSRRYLRTTPATVHGAFRLLWHAQGR